METAAVDLLFIHAHLSFAVRLSPGLDNQLTLLLPTLLLLPLLLSEFF